MLRTAFLPRVPQAHGSHVVHVLISLTKKKHIHNTSRHRTGAKIAIFFQDGRTCADRESWSRAMSDHSTYWHTRAEQMRALASEAKGEISKHVMSRIADDYERFAQTIEQRPNRFLASRLL